MKETNVCSDATLEEVWHIIQGQGYAPAFKKQFWMGTRDDLATKYKNVNSTLVTLLDAARGGIPRVPAVPKGAKFPAKVSAMNIHATFLIWGGGWKLEIFLHYWKI